MEFRWTPGIGPDAEALARMCRQAPMPKTAMGEAWFMGEQRRMFDELLACSDAGPEIEVALAPLEEIISGTSSFGPMPEWRNWFHYLLPRLIKKAPDAGHLHQELTQVLVSASISQYPGGIGDAPYQGFGEDLLATLGQTLMHASCWNGRSIRLGRVLWETPAAQCMWGWAVPAGDLSSSLFLCLKYLEPGQIDDWLASVLSIEDPYWRAQVLIWAMQAVKAARLADWQPSDLADDEGGWSRSDQLDGHYDGHHVEPVQRVAFLEVPSRQAFSRALVQRLSPEVIAQWAASIRAVDDLGWEVEGYLAELAYRGNALWPAGS